MDIDQIEEIVELQLRQEDQAEARKMIATIPVDEIKKRYFCREAKCLKEANVLQCCMDILGR